MRRIDIDARNVLWAENGSMMAVVAADAFFVLKFNREVCRLLHMSQPNLSCLPSLAFSISYFCFELSFRSACIAYSRVNLNLIVQAVQTAFDTNVGIDEEGIESAFELIGEVCCVAAIHEYPSDSALCCL